MLRVKKYLFLFVTMQNLLEKRYASYSYITTLYYIYI